MNRLKIEDSLSVSLEHINNWIDALGLKMEKSFEDSRIGYSEEAVILLNKISNLFLNGVAVSTIKEVLATDIEIYNENALTHEVLVNAQESMASRSTDLMTVERNSDSLSLKNKDSFSFKQGSMIVQSFLGEMQTYMNRTIEAEKELALLKNSEVRLRESYIEASSEIKALKEKNAVKDKLILDLKKRNKKIDKVALQFQLLKIEMSKKRKWAFWK